MPMLYSVALKPSVQHHRQVSSGGAQVRGAGHVGAGGGGVAPQAHSAGGKVVLLGGGAALGGASGRGVVCGAALRPAVGIQALHPQRHGAGRGTTVWSCSASCTLCQGSLPCRATSGWRSWWLHLPRRAHHPPTPAPSPLAKASWARGRDVASAQAASR